MSSLAIRVLLGWAAFVLVGWGVGELWTSVGPSEAQLMREVARERSAALVSAARVITWAGSVWLLGPLALLASILLLRAGLREGALIVALGLLGGALMADAIKLLVGRPRPPVEHLQAVTGYSFPSGHATQAAAFWVSLALALRPLVSRRLVLGLLACACALIVLAVCLSRVTLGVHYPSDVLAGALLGGGWAVYVWRCARETAPRRAAR
jgi:membrane-associated phospholipid phosphatase